MKSSGFLLGLCSANNALHSDGVLDLDAGADMASMNRPEQKLLLQKIFGRMDKSNNGLIERGEMLDWTWMIEKKYMAKDVENWMRFYDIDEDGIVAEEEFIKQLDRRTFGHKGARDLEQRRFRAVDADSDGALNVDEFYPFLYPRHYAEVKSFWLEEIFQAFDTDSDGNVSFADYLSYQRGLTVDQLSANDMIREKKYFDQNDADGNGWLNIKEVGQLIDPGDDCIITTLADQFFYAADKSGDNSLTFDEMLHNYDDLLDSHITAHGAIRHDEL